MLSRLRKYKQPNRASGKAASLLRYLTNKKYGKQVRASSVLAIAAGLLTNTTHAKASLVSNSKVLSPCTTLSLLYIFSIPLILHSHSFTATPLGALQSTVRLLEHPWLPIRVCVSVAAIMHLVKSLIVVTLATPFVVAGPRGQLVWYPIDRTGLADTSHRQRSSSTCRRW